MVVILARQQRWKKQHLAGSEGAEPGLAAPRDTSLGRQERRSPVQLVQRSTAALLAAVAAVQLEVVGAAGRQAVEHLTQRREFPHSPAVLGSHREGAAALWERETLSVLLNEIIFSNTDFS